MVGLSRSYIIDIYKAISPRKYFYIKRNPVAPSCEGTPPSSAIYTYNLVTIIAKIRQTTRTLKWMRINIDNIDKGDKAAPAINLGGLDPAGPCPNYHTQSSHTSIWK